MWTRLYAHRWKKLEKYGVKHIHYELRVVYLLVWSHNMRKYVILYCFDLYDLTFIPVLTHSHASLILAISTCLCLLGCAVVLFHSMRFVFLTFFSLFQTCHLIPLNVQRRDWTRSHYWWRSIIPDAERLCACLLSFILRLLCMRSKRC